MHYWQDGTPVTSINSKSVKAPFTRDVRKNTVLGFALCYICHLTPPLMLYLVYITRNGALINTYINV